jgi:hypothetical protein
VLLYFGTVAGLLGRVDFVTCTYGHSESSCESDQRALCTLLAPWKPSKFLGPTSLWGLQLTKKYISLTTRDQYDSLLFTNVHCCYDSTSTLFCFDAVVWPDTSWRVSDLCRFRNQAGQ